MNDSKFINNLFYEVRKKECKLLFQHFLLGRIGKKQKSLVKTLPDDILSLVWRELVKIDNYFLFRKISQTKKYTKDNHTDIEIFFMDSDDICCLGFYNSSLLFTTFGKWGEYVTFHYEKRLAKEIYKHNILDKSSIILR